MDDNVERLRRLLSAMSEVDVEAAEYLKLRAQLISELVRMQAEQDLLERLRRIQDRIDSMGELNPDFDIKGFMDESWEK